jgi:hypothetical protein
MGNDLFEFACKLLTRIPRLPGVAANVASIAELRHTSVRLFDTKDTRAVIRRILVRQTKISLAITFPLVH